MCERENKQAKERKGNKEEEKEKESGRQAETREGGEGVRYSHKYIHDREITISKV